MLLRITGSPKPQRIPPPPALATPSPFATASFPSMMLYWMMGEANSQRIPPPSRYRILWRGSSQRVPVPPVMVKPWTTEVVSWSPSMMRTLAVSGSAGRLPSRMVLAMTERSPPGRYSLVSTRLRERKRRFS